MKWDGLSKASWMNSLRLRLIYWMLRRMRASCLELQAPGVHVLSKDDFTLVIWRVRQGSPSRLRATLRMSMVKLSTWSSRRWKLSQTLEQPGNPGVARGIPPTQSISNSPDLPSARGNGEENLPSNKCPS